MSPPAASSLGRRTGARLELPALGPLLPHNWQHSASAEHLFKVGLQAYLMEEPSRSEDENAKSRTEAEVAQRQGQPQRTRKHRGNPAAKL